MRVSALCVLGLLLPLCLLGSTSLVHAKITSPAWQGQEKSAIPEEKALAAAREKVRAKFADKYAKATAKKETRELSKALLDLASSLHDDSVDRYAALLEAHELAVKGRDCKFGLDIVEKMGEWYAPLDKDAWRRGVVLAIAGAERLQLSEKRDLAREGLPLLEEFLLREDAQASAELRKALEAPIKGADDDQAKQRLAAAEKALDYLKALEKLKSDPSDPEANFTVGWRVAFVMGQVETGLENLARASDEHEALKKRVRLDLANPTVAAAQEAVGDAWMAWSKSQGEPARGIAQERAKHWYLLARAQLSGVERIDLEEKLGKIAGAAPPATSSPHPGAAPAKGDPEAAEVREAIDRALSWLAKHQSPDGRWSAAAFSRQCEKNVCGGPGGEMYDTGATGLALLCFLRGGETHESSPFGEHVKKGLGYLTTIQKKDGEGCFGKRFGTNWIYNHACATIAMTEAYGMTKAAAFKAPAQKAIDFVLAAQNPYAAWRYTCPGNGDNDSSVTGWMVIALSSAKLAGLKIDKFALASAIGFIEEVTDPASGRTGYTSVGEHPSRLPSLASAFPSEMSESLTAVGLLVRTLCGRTLESDPMIGKGADLLVRKLPEWKEGGSIDFYYWYYGTLALQRVGGKRRDKWNDALRAALLDNQRVNEAEHQCGSWDPVDPWSTDGGRVYATALNCLSLVAYHRHLASSR